MHKIRFRKGSVSLLRIIRIWTPIRVILFYVVLIYTLFLLSLKDIDRLRVKLNNLTNELI